MTAKSAARALALLKIEKRQTASTTLRRRQSRGGLTRQKIKDAFIGLINTQDYFDITIADICRAADVAIGGFYFHYKKKSVLIDEVLREHSANFWAGLDAALHYQDPYSAIFHASTAFVRGFHDSAGLVRCFNQLAMTDRTYVRLWEAAAAKWVRRVVVMVKASGEPGRAHANDANAYALLSFIDLLLLKLYVEKDPAIVAAAGAVDEVIENIAVLWYRALTGQSPASSRLTYASRGLGV